MWLMDSTETARRLEALGNATRLEIFRTLVRAGPDGLPVGEIQSRTGTARSTLSHHLHKLIAVDLVRQERDGTTLYCHANYSEMQATIDYLTRECCADARGRSCDAA
ncbi:transcriptional regulator, ArsR family [Thalassobaculum litoreum DSM 18839]|uniref:Transcriptional regulator, ArsR family n=2 Tax=Thalassobaculaceae TaxID=2844864 RepID=A0A8G2BLR7_9PROT|nr:transcriptional regulator, ArsR family [Thalassobaculum litoreum DSM 18839]